METLDTPASLGRVCHPRDVTAALVWHLPPPPTARLYIVKELEHYTDAWLKVNGSTYIQWGITLP